MVQQVTYTHRMFHLSHSAVRAKNLTQGFEFNWWKNSFFCDVHNAHNTRTTGVILWTGLDSNCMYVCLIVIAIQLTGTNPKYVPHFLYTHVHYSIYDNSMTEVYMYVLAHTHARTHTRTHTHTHTHTSPVYIIKWSRVMWSVLIQTMLYSMYTPWLYKNKRGSPNHKWQGIWQHGTCNQVILTWIILSSSR